MISIYNQFCFGRRKKIKSGSKKVVVKPIILTEFMNRRQLDLIEFQSMPDGVYKWAGHYQDHQNKLTYIFALKSKC